MSSGLILIILLAVVVVFVISVYNGLVRARNYFKNAYAQIDVQLTRRYDLIPNLVETAKTYMAHEKDTLAAVIEARNQAHDINVNVAADPSNPQNMQKLIEAEKKLTSSMGSFYAVAENYPDLKANATMTQLNEELTSTENKISFARQAFNDSVTAFNNKREVFPNNFVAGMFNFKEAALLDIEDPKKREAVKVQF